MLVTFRMPNAIVYASMLLSWKGSCSASPTIQLRPPPSPTQYKSCCVNGYQFRDGLKISGFSSKSYEAGNDPPISNKLKLNEGGCQVHIPKRCCPAFLWPSLSMSGLMSHTWTWPSCTGVGASLSSCCLVWSSAMALSTLKATSPVPPATSRWHMPAKGCNRVTNLHVLLIVLTHHHTQALHLKEGCN
jgi:hypothetical protein